MDKPISNVYCAWCNTPLSHNPQLAKGKVSHTICPNCMPKLGLKEIYDNLDMINEDWGLAEPTRDTHLPTMSARHTMTQLPGQEDRDDLMKPYKYTADNSMKISNMIRRIYRRINNKNAVPKTRLPFGF